ncbi:MAG: zinc ribbon domain-containing protein [Dehalococcoidia bacterium]|nr:zinc ribbon domain-containing protein [Dehalococcoidia bacterium]
MQEYQCQQCKDKFVERDESVSETESEVRCPACGSTNVEKSGSPAGVRGFLRSLLRPT